MKSYLSLIKISEDSHKRKDRMTILCIVFAVFLVTAIFSMADMGVSMEKARIIAKHGEGALENIKVSSSFNALYIIAIFLFVLVLLSGILMISGSLNSNIAKRTEFFGMLRCIGMTKKQTIRFVKLEALNLCKIAIPIGIGLGMLASMLLASILKYKVGGEFALIPVFKISILGILSGFIVGFLSVMISSSIPARKASEVSPITAVSGNIYNKSIKPRKRLFKHVKIEKLIGMNNAFAKKKNYILITSSFALSIILFLTFSVFTDFIGYIMPQFSNQPDYSIYSERVTNEIPMDLLEKLKEIEDIKNVFGRQNTTTKFKLSSGFSDNLDLISYDKFDLKALEKDGLLETKSDISKVIDHENYAIITDYNKETLDIGDELIINGKKLEIAGVLKYNIFNSDALSDEKLNVITNYKTFINITGIEDYSLVLIQSKENLNDKKINEIKSLLGDRYVFKDNTDQNTSSTYLAFNLFVYGFLMIIAFVSLLNIINIVSLSVESKLKQYGVMRAIGMSKVQLKNMILTEALTYSISGLILGSIVGVLISRKIFEILISNHFSYAVWMLPHNKLIIAIVFIGLSTLLSIYKPIKHIDKISITENINML